MRLYLWFSFLTLPCLLPTSISLSARSTACPCSQPEFCKLVGRNAHPEVYGFLIKLVDPAVYSLFDWNRITTLSIHAINDPKLDQLVCFAHKKRVRVTVWFSFEVDILTNKTLRQNFIRKTVNSVVVHHLDGVNIDFEKPLTSPALIGQLTETVRELTSALRQRNPSYQVTFSHFPIIIEKSRFRYDVVALSRLIDFFVVMDYDLFYSPVGGGLCLAGAVSNYPTVVQSIDSFLAAGIPPEKLVTAFPWYGYRVQCLGLNKTNGECKFKCNQKHSICYSSAMRRLRENSIGGRHFNETSKAPFFFYSERGNDGIWRVDYDDRWSLTIRVDYALSRKLRGVGVFRFDCLDSTPGDIAAHDRLEIWKSLPTIQDDNFLYF